MALNNIVTAIVPIFLVVGVGYGFVRFGPFSRDDMPVLSRFVVKVALPLLIFLNIYGKPASDIFQVTYLLTYAGAVLIMFGIAFGYSAAKKRTPARRAFLGMGMSSTNNGFIGLPIFLILLPEWAGAAVGMDMLVDNTLTIPLTLFLAEQAIGTGTIRERVITTIRGVLLHPLVIAIIAALVLNAVGLVLPEFLHRSVDLIAGTSTGVALFTVGGMLVGLQIKGALADIFMIVGSKLLIMPTVAFGLLMSFIAIGLPDLPNELRAAAIITCALPPFSIMPSIAEPYGEADVTTAAMMLSTLLSFFTLAGWTAVLGAIGWI